MPRPKGQLIDGRLARSRRHHLNLTQEELAQRCELTRALVQKAERGGPLSTSSVSALSTALDVPAESLLLDEDWNLNLEGRIAAPLLASAAPRIGSAWTQPRQTLYHLPPQQLIVIALRAAVRVLPAFDPRNTQAGEHFQSLVRGAATAHQVLNRFIDGTGNGNLSSALQSAADPAYVAAGFAVPGEYEHDAQAADAAFSSAISIARILDALLMESRRAHSKTDADHWRTVELAATTCQSAGHASTYLQISDAFMRAATLDTRDLQNSQDSGAIMRKPLWEGGKVPAKLEYYLQRMTRLEYFSVSARALWSRWAHKGLS